MLNWPFSVASSMVGSESSVFNRSRRTMFSRGGFEERATVWVWRFTSRGTSRLGERAFPSHFKNPSSRYKSVVPKSSSFSLRACRICSFTSSFCWGVKLSDLGRNESSGRGPPVCFHFSKNRSPVSSIRGVWYRPLVLKFKSESLESKRADSWRIFERVADKAALDMP